MEQISSNAACFITPHRLLLGDLEGITELRYAELDARLTERHRDRRRLPGAPAIVAEHASRRHRVRFSKSGNDIRRAAK